MDQFLFHNKDDLIARQGQGGASPPGCERSSSYSTAFRSSSTSWREPLKPRRRAWRRRAREFRERRAEVVCPGPRSASAPRSTNVSPPKSLRIGESAHAQFFRGDGHEQVREVLRSYCAVDSASYRGTTGVRRQVRGRHLEGAVVRTNVATALARAGRTLQPRLAALGFVRHRHTGAKPRGSRAPGNASTQATAPVWACIRNTRCGRLRGVDPPGKPIVRASTADNSRENESPQDSWSSRCSGLLRFLQTLLAP